MAQEEKSICISLTTDSKTDEPILNGGLPISLGIDFWKESTILSYASTEYGRMLNDALFHIAIIALCFGGIISDIILIVI